MKRSVSAGLTIVLLSAPATALTLDEAYQLALKNLETVAISKASVDSAEQDLARRIALRYPSVSLLASEKLQGVQSGTVNGVPTKTFVRQWTPDVSIELVGPLFSGFREYAAVRSAKATVAASTQELARAQQLVYADVA